MVLVFTCVLYCVAHVERRKRRVMSGKRRVGKEKRRAVSEKWRRREKDVERWRDAKKRRRKRRGEEMRREEKSGEKDHITERESRGKLKGSEQTCATAWKRSHTAGSTSFSGCGSRC